MPFESLIGTLAGVRIAVKRIYDRGFKELTQNSAQYALQRLRSFAATATWMST